MIKVIIVDDEPLALDILETYIEQFPELQLICRCESANDAKRALEEQRIDLMFLDIQMPEMTGVDFLKSLEEPPLTILCTAYPNFAVEGFELNAVDYLLKPVSLERFQKAIQKATELLNVKSDNKQIDKLKDADYFFVKADKKLIKVNYENILYIEGLKDYVIIRTDQSKIITLQTMKSLEEKLPDTKFIRIHRSFIVSVDKINAVIGNMIEVIEKGQSKLIPIGKNYRDELTEIVNQNKL
ncbi:MAG TPA: LytTR family DNA-binding domain-containing protein [Saprospiraceae bacterium]|nr:LytTR family DNA-binding domain-containing protein [Saprospiraceae bacterium]